MSTAQQNLTGKVVLVTRPAHQADAFIELLEKNGAKALSFPTIDILARPLDDALRKSLSSLNENDMLIFISANAVSNTVLHLSQLGIEASSIQCEIGVIGSATRKAALESGLKVSLLPEAGFNSEAFLQLDAVQSTQIKGQQVLIIRGVGGREELATELQKRGACTEYAEVYQRIIPLDDAHIQRQQLSQHWHDFGINTVTVTSNESLQNLYDMLQEPGRTELLNRELIVPSQRCYKLAESLKFSSIKLAKSATNQQMMEAI